MPPEALLTTHAMAWHQQKIFELWELWRTLENSGELWRTLENSGVLKVQRFFADGQRNLPTSATSWVLNEHSKGKPGQLIAIERLNLMAMETVIVLATVTAMMALAGPHGSGCTIWYTWFSALLHFGCLLIGLQKNHPTNPQPTCLKVKASASPSILSIHPLMPTPPRHKVIPRLPAASPYQVFAKNTANPPLQTPGPGGGMPHTSCRTCKAHLLVKGPQITRKRDHWWVLLWMLLSVVWSPLLSTCTSHLPFCIFHSAPADPHCSPAHSASATASTTPETPALLQSGDHLVSPMTQVINWVALLFIAKLCFLCSSWPTTYYYPTDTCIVLCSCQAFHPPFLLTWSCPPLEFLALHHPFILCL